MSEKKVCAMIGAGPGTGAAVARRFAREGYQLALFARRTETIATLAAELKARAIPADAGDPASIQAAFAEVKTNTEILVYNAGAFHMGGILDLTPEVFESCWRSNCYGAFLAAREVLPSMLE